MIHIRCRSDLVFLIARDTKSPAIRRACCTGTVEFYGAFQEIPSAGVPGWVFRIITKHGEEHLVGVVLNITHHRLVLRTLDKVPWRTWIGSALPEKAEFYLDNGDHPKIYELYRLAAGGATT